MPEAPDFDWDEANIGHIARHDVVPEEVEQAFAHHPVTLEAQMSSSGESRTLAAGYTDAGRPLQFVYAIRNGKIRIVTAHVAHRKVRPKLWKPKKPK